jgi:Sec-independent protein translocase protein TatA
MFLAKVSDFNVIDICIIAVIALVLVGSIAYQMAKAEKA